MDEYSEMLGDDLSDMLEDDEIELGKFSFGKMLKGVGKVARGALKVAKIIPGVGSIAAAADMGLDVADKVGGAIRKGKNTIKDIKKLGKAAGISVGKKGKKGQAAPAASPQARAIAARARVEAAEEDRDERPRTGAVRTQSAAAERVRPAMSSGGSVEAQAAKAEPTVIIQAAPLDVGALVRQFSAQVSPQLSAVAAIVQRMNIQAAATAEHKKRAGDLAFKRAVLKKLGS